MEKLTRRRFLRASAAGPVAATGGALAAAPSAARAAQAAAGTRTLTFTAATGASVTAAPDGSRLIAEIQGVLWALPRAGGEATALTPPGLEPTRPAWSPDGTQVALVAYRGGAFHLWTMAPDGSGLRQLTDGPWDDRGAAWSPDGTRIAFASERGGDPVTGAPYRVWTVDARTGEPRRLSAGPGEEYDPTWTPDGARVLFVRAHPDGTQALVSVPAEGGPATVEQPVPEGSAVCPAVGPDGRIAHVHLTTGPTGPRAALVVAGRPVTTGEDVFPAPPRWLSRDELLYLADGRLRVRRVPAQGPPGPAAPIPFTARVEVPRPRYRGKAYDFDGAASRPVRGLHLPALSPDGRRVAFAALGALWVTTPGGRPRRLVQAPPTGYLTGPAWSPDGRAVLYCDDRDGLYAVRRHDLRDGTDTVLADGGRVNAAPSPDGTRLACHDLTGNLLVRDLATGEERVLAAPLGGGGLPGAPSWSPDGRYLATADRNRLNQRFREGYNLIRVIDTRTGASRLHTPRAHLSLSDRFASGPVWSPDGRWMAFVAESALWTVPVTPEGAPAGAPRRVTDEPADHPSWSGDSRTLLYLSNGRLRLVPHGGGTPRTLPVPLTHRRALPGPSAVTRVHAGLLWDGVADTPRRDMDVVLRGNRVHAVEPHRAGPARPGERLVDASERTVLPGLWDAHTHPWQSTYGGRQTSLNLAYGVTTTVSLGGAAYEGVRLREALAAGELTGPRLFATGELIDGARVAYSMGRAHRTRDGVRRTLERAVALDFDFVKTYVRAPGWIMAEAERVAHEELGVRVGSHLCTPGINLGHDLTTHLQATQRLEYGHATSPTGRAYQDVFATYGPGGLTLIATPFTARPLTGEDPALAEDPRVTELMPPWDTAAVRQAAAARPTRAQLRALETEVGIYRRVLQAGGLLALGTDAPLVPVGLHLHLALRALRRYGLSAAQALRTATVLPARAFGVADHLGTVEPGKLADLVIVDGDPFRDFSSLVRTEAVLVGGTLVRQEELLGRHRGARVPAGDVDWLDIGRRMRRDCCCG
ncbi:amidohydrolase family protein [Streptomyces capparidis]